MFTISAIHMLSIGSKMLMLNTSPPGWAHSFCDVDLVEAVARLNLLADIQGLLPTDFTYTDGKVTKDRDPSVGQSQLWVRLSNTD